MTDFPAILKALGNGSVEFIIVGGIASTIHGSARETTDVDVVYRRSEDNLLRIVEALRTFEPYPRGAPPGLPFRWSVETLRHGLNFTLTLTLGDLDLHGEIAGGGTYESLLPQSGEVEVFGITCRCLGLDRLIEAKRAAGRPKDFEAIAELQSIRTELQDSD